MKSPKGAVTLYSDNQSPTNDNRQPSTTIDNQLPTKFSIDNRSPTSCRPVANQLPITRRSDANHSPIGRRVNFGSSLKFENQSATGCHKINDWSATIRRSVADHSALGEQRLDKFMHTDLKLLLWAWQSKELLELLMRKVTAYYSFVILIILLTAKHA